MGLSCLKDSVPTDYQLALQSYWHSARDKCVSAIQDKLLTEACDETSPAYYRLWIDDLARREEKDSLEELNRHLLTQGLEWPEFSTTFRALRGIIHLEKDEFKMATLLSETFQDDEEENPWILEFLERLSHRTTPKTYLKNIETIDYFHYQTAATTQIMLNQPKECEKILKVTCNKIFTDCPDLLLFQIHSKLDEASQMWEFDALIDRAKTVSQRWKENIEGWFLLGYLQVRAERFPEAIETLEHANKMAMGRDTDILTLLAHSYITRADHTHGTHHAQKVQSEDWKHSDSLFRTSKDRMIQSGLPIREVSLSIESLNLDKHLANNIEELPGKRVWALFVGANQFNTLRTENEEDIQYIFQHTPVVPSPNDIVLMLWDEEQQCRLASVYVVAGEPTWHPLHKNESILQLCTRPERSITLDIERTPEEKRKNILEFEIEAIDHIFEGIRTHNDPYAETSFEPITLAKTS
ncbi:MAG: tetratricopeptide repeat protein [Oligoflexales bacterium]